MNNINKLILPPDPIILEQVKKRKDIIYGARSLNRQVPAFLRRPTKDYDIFSRANPRSAAVQMEKKLDKSYGGDFYYVKPALHKGTYKVIDKGQDMRKGTKDDFGIVDYTKVPRGLKTKQIEGIYYSALSVERANRKKALADKAFAFRKEKDKYDLETMRLRNKMVRGT